eukprot:m.56488 g.56488  ORF g.56488 m.56488 type:complete len:758 (+) comp12617_c1_seq1:102-2375(+)
MAASQDEVKFAYASTVALAVYSVEARVARSPLYTHDTNRSWREGFLSRLVAHLALAPAATLPVLYEIALGAVVIDPGVLVDVLELGVGESGVDCRFEVLQDALGVMVADGVYDARSREVLSVMAMLLGISSRTVAAYETLVAKTMSDLKAAVDVSGAADASASTSSDAMDAARQSKHRSRWVKIGFGAVIGGAIIGLTGGLAAPLVAASAGALFANASVAATLTSINGIYAIGTLFGVYGAASTGKRMHTRVRSLREFWLLRNSNSSKLPVFIGIAGWVRNEGKQEEFQHPWKHVNEEFDSFALVWESKDLSNFARAIQNFLLSQATGQVIAEVVQETALQALQAAIALPSNLLKLGFFIDNIWAVCLSRAEAAGVELAHTLVARDLGGRPVTLAGYSLGARVVFFCLQELARLNEQDHVDVTGIVQTVVVAGLPAPGRAGPWKHFAPLVAGKIFNVYLPNDWLLSYVFRGSTAELHVAGLTGVDRRCDFVVNVDASDLVKGHLDYPQAMPKILRHTGLNSAHFGAAAKCNIGQRVFLPGKGHGILRYCGVPKESLRRVYLGVEMDHPVGKGSGKVQGQFCFQGRKDRAVFVSKDSGKARLADDHRTLGRCYSASCLHNCRWRCYSPLCMAARRQAGAGVRKSDSAHAHDDDDGMSLADLLPTKVVSLMNLPASLLRTNDPAAVAVAAACYSSTCSGDPRRCYSPSCRACLAGLRAHAKGGPGQGSSEASGFLVSAARWLKGLGPSTASKPKPKPVE